MIGMGMVIGLLIAKTGHDKEFILARLAVVTFGFWLFTQLHHHSTQTQLTVAMVVVGLSRRRDAMQTYTFVVQNGVMRRDLAWLPPPPTSSGPPGRLSASRYSAR